MDRGIAKDLPTWHEQQTRDPRRLALGSASWRPSAGVASEPGRFPRDELEALIALARGAGIRSIETARAWHESECAIGEALGDDPDWRVLTRLAPDVHVDGLGLGEVLERVSSSLEASRRALAREALAGLLLHRFAHRHACGGRIWRMLLAEREAGRIAALGVCTATPEEAWAALEDPDIEILQVATSLLDLRLHRQGFFARARELGRSVYVADACLQGLADLAPESLPSGLDPLGPALEQIRSLARELEVPPRAVSLAFVRELPGVRPIMGCKTASQLAELLGDWESDRVTAAQVLELAAALPIHDAVLVDAARWPAPTGPASRDPRQPPSAGIATMPA
ncbi:MAG: aldo/keto reductase [Deltaproteobacteria bacterium]|jgi:aryl-alcohol dehydrogenase-like predicted oxidoreductase|nr:aldo/keto reductase [Deltaproteobacteria bacterium]